MKETRWYKEIKLTKYDKAFLNRIGVIVEGIAKLLGTNCEVLLHSLEDPAHSVIKIENGHVTGRAVGSPLTDFAVDILGKVDSLSSDVVGSYMGKTEDGRQLKSVTIVLRGPLGKPIGLMCINVDLSAPLLDFLRGFLAVGEESITKEVTESFPSNVNELISKTIEVVMRDINIQRELSPSVKNKLITEELYKRGMFDIKGVIDIVAKQMGISRYSVYNYIRDAKARLGL